VAGIRFTFLCTAWGLLTFAPVIAAGQMTIQLTDSTYYPLKKPTDVVFPVKCDDRGNVYFRSAARGPGKFDVVEVAPDGSEKATYTYSDNPELKDDTLLADAKGEHGDMYELLKARGQRLLLLRFSEDGQLEKTEELEVRDPFTPSHLDVLARGILFVSGTLVGDKSGHRAGQPVNAFYGSDGRMIRETHLKQDPGNLKQPLNEADRSGSQNNAVHFGRTAVGDDGNLYVMRATSPAIVYVVSLSGRTERTLTVQPPAKGAQPIALLVHSGRVAIEFSFAESPDVSDTRIRLVDARSGHTISDYGITTDLGEAVACYDGEQFTFLGSKDGWPSLIRTPIH
jgi:hypothetical protein